MFESMKTNAVESFANINKRLRTVVTMKITKMIKRFHDENVNLLSMIETRSITNSDKIKFLEQLQCDSYLNEFFKYFSGEKLDQLVSLSKTFEHSIDYLTTIQQKCSHVPLMTRCGKLVVSELEVIVK